MGKICTTLWFTPLSFRIQSIDVVRWESYNATSWTISFRLRLLDYAETGSWFASHHSNALDD